MDICLDNEDHCYQLISKDGYEMRECWDLKYENEEYAASGCYSGKHCHHEHCWDDVTVCICDSPECNDWSPEVSVITRCQPHVIMCHQGNVTTPVPVTDGSGVLCYTGSPQAGDLEPHFCLHSQTMCRYSNISQKRNIFRIWSILTIRDNTDVQLPADQGRHGAGRLL